MALIKYNAPHELPRREVTIQRPFAIGKYEVTVAQFDHYVRETGAQVGGACKIRLMEQGHLPGSSKARSTLPMTRKSRVPTPSKSRTARIVSQGCP